VTNSWKVSRIDNYQVSGESTKSGNKKLAERIHAKRLTEIAEGRWFPNEAKRRTFEEFKERYMREHSAIHKSKTSHERDIQSFKQLSKCFGGMTLADITPARISDYNSLSQNGGVKTSTISKELELLRGALNLALREWEWLEKKSF